MMFKRDAQHFFHKKKTPSIAAITEMSNQLFTLIVITGLNN